MMQKINQWLRIKPGEGGLVFALGLILFANYAAMGITKVIAVSGFLSQVKDQYILLVWAADMVLLILATGLQSLIIDRFNRVVLLGGVLLVFTLLYAVLPFAFLSKTFPSEASYTLIYLLNDQQWRFFPVVFWILVNDVYEPAQGRRLIPVIANFAFVGTIFGLGVAAIDARVNFGPVKLLFFNAAIFLLAFLISRLGLKKIDLHTTSRTASSIKQVFSEGFDFIKTVPAFAHLSIIMLATGIIMTVLLYDALSDAKLALGAGFQAFYAQYNLLIAFGSIFLQSNAGKLIEKLSLKNSFLVQPAIMFLTTLANFFIPGFMSSSTAQAIARINYDTVDVSARKAIQALVPNEKRGRVSMFIDSYLPSFGTIVGSLVTFGIVMLGIRFALPRSEYTLIYLGIAVAVALLAIFKGNQLRQAYDVSMLNWQLKRRKRGSSVIDRLDFGDEDKK